MDERGSALVVTLMLLVILTAIGIYAISISTTEMGIALQSRVGTGALNSADAGANYGMNRVPEVLLFEESLGLPDGSLYRVTSRTTGVMTLRAGYGSNFRFADFEVTSRGEPPPQFTGSRSVQAVVDFGPVPTGTMY
ncbi:MAG: pilus assembly PilX N-terminal domain-containing protein [Thermodesulfobacteriota bacterium]